MAKIKRIAILATGDELVHGEILNTNGQYIAQRFYDDGIETGMHMVVADEQSALEKAIRYLLQNHDALITIGGLGPTSDDRTRFALAESLVRPLEFNKDSWQRIVARLQGKKLEVSKSNRQQAFFPLEAEIIPNANGTADACHINHDGKLIYMLPGPPNEFKPIFDEIVFPNFIRAGYAHTLLHQHWMLFGVSESQIAEHIDPIVQQSQAQIGYRVQYPYLELKLHAEDAQVLAQVSKQIIQALIDNHADVRYGRFIMDGQAHASTKAKELLSKTDKIIWINDKVTHGLLQVTLDTPITTKHCYFTFHEPEQYDIKITLQGLTEYWQDNHPNWQFSKINMEITDDEQTQTHQESVPNRGHLTPSYATELISWHLIKVLR